MTQDSYYNERETKMYRYEDRDRGRENRKRERDNYPRKAGQKRTYSSPEKKSYRNDFEAQNENDL